jgi:hypothetical protein
MVKKIKIGYDSKTNLYLVKYSDIKSYPGEILVDGKKMENPLGHPYMVLKELPKKIEKITTGRNFIGWKNDRKLITQEEFDLLSKEITSKGVFTWDDEDQDSSGYSFDDIEDKIKWIRFKAEWKREYTEDPIIEEIEIEVVNLPVSDIPEITPMFLSGGNIFETMCEYHCNSADLFRSRCEKLGFKKADNDSQKGNVYWLSHKDNFRFAKLGGEYCSNDTDVQKVRSFRRGSYDELKDLHERNIKEIDSIINLWISKRDEKKLTSIQIGDQIKFMEGILNSIRSLGVKKSDQSSYYSIIKRISDRLNDFRDTV